MVQCMFKATVTAPTRSRGARAREAAPRRSPGVTAGGSAVAPQKPQSDIPGFPLVGRFSSRTRVACSRPCGLRPHRPLCGLSAVFAVPRTVTERKGDRRSPRYARTTTPATRATCCPLTHSSHSAECTVRPEPWRRANASGCGRPREYHRTVHLGNRKAEPRSERADRHSEVTYPSRPRSPAYGGTRPSRDA